MSIKILKLQCAAGHPIIGAAYDPAITTTEEAKCALGLKYADLIRSQRLKPNCATCGRLVVVLRYEEQETIFPTIEEAHENAKELGGRVMRDDTQQSVQEEIPQIGLQPDELALGVIVLRGTGIGVRWMSEIFVGDRAMSDDIRAILVEVLRMAADRIESHEEDKNVADILSRHMSGGQA